jgi:hypothetical protein
MIDRKRYELIRQKHGKHASWAIWATQAQKAKSNMGDITIFNNESIIPQLRPNLLMVGLNLSRATPEEPFRNFHDSSPRAQDYKIRHAFIGTEFYGAYMTDIIKGLVEVDSKNVIKHLKNNPDSLETSLKTFREEIADLGVTASTILAFGAIAHKVLFRNLLPSEYTRLIKLTHYSHQISKEIYKATVLEEISSA